MPPRRKVKFPRYVHLTLSAAGWLFLVVATMVGVAAARNQAALMFIMFGAMLGAVVVSILLAYRTVGAVRLGRDLPDRAWQNQTVYLGYTLRNAMRRFSCLGLSVSEVHARGIDAVEGFCVHLPGRGTFRAGARFVPRSRGRIILHGLKVVTRFPFGLVTARKAVPQPASLIVWPAKGKLTEHLLHRGAVQASCSPPTAVQGGQDEFLGLRDYREGDSLRWIHWKRSATRSAPVVREMARPRPEILMLVLDTLLPWNDPRAAVRRERTLRFAATLIDFAFHRGYQVGLALAYRDRVAAMAPASGLGRRTALLDALADVDDNGSRSLDETLNHVERGMLSAAQVVVVTCGSGPLGAARAGALARASGHLTVLDEGELDRVFRDDPLAAAEAGRCR
jgi:uncharacterized protein (DUF58 family)